MKNSMRIESNTKRRPCSWTVNSSDVSESDLKTSCDKPGFLRLQLPLLILAWLVLAINAPSAFGQSSQQAEGFTEPFKTVVVASPESGIIQSLTVREGDMVRDGDVLAQLDSQVLIASANAAREKLKARGKINGAIASVQNKAHLLRQMEELLKGEHASDKEVKQAQLEFDLANANLESAKDELRAQEMEIKRIEAQLERRIIRAPNSGVVLELPRQVGEAISATESQVATIVSLDQLRVRYFLTTSQAKSIEHGSRMQVGFPETGQTTTAIVDFVSPVTDSKSGTVRVEFLIENKNGAFRSGRRCVLGGLQTAKQSLNLKQM